MVAGQRHPNFSRIDHADARRIAESAGQVGGHGAMLRSGGINPEPNPPSRSAGNAAARQIPSLADTNPSARFSSHYRNHARSTVQQGAVRVVSLLLQAIANQDVHAERWPALRFDLAPQVGLRGEVFLRRIAK